MMMPEALNNADRDVYLVLQLLGTISVRKKKHLKMLIEKNEDACLRFASI